MAQILKQVLGCTIISDNGQTWAAFEASLPGYAALVEEKTRVREAQRVQAQAKRQRVQRSQVKRPQVVVQSKARPSVSQNRPQPQVKKGVKEGQQKTVVITGDARMYAQLGWDIIGRKGARRASPRVNLPALPAMSSAEQERRRQELIERNRQEQNQQKKVHVLPGSLTRVERVERLGLVCGKLA